MRMPDMPPFLHTSRVRSFDVEGSVTGFGSPDWAATHDAATSTAPAVAACQAAGARGTVKTVMDELAFSIAGENAHYGTPTNTAAPGRLPGGSSSGSAVAVAAGLVDFALGTDTGGSVRVPAAHCGLFGIRPTHGAVSTLGVLPMAPSFDTVGWFARDARTLARVGKALLPRPKGLTDGDSPPAVRVLAVAEDCLRLGGPDAVAAVAALLQGAAVACPGAQASRLKVGAFFREQCPALGPFVTGAFDPAADGDSAPPGEVDGEEDDNNHEGLTAMRTALRVLQGHELWSAHGGWVSSARPDLAPDVRSRVDFAASVTPAAAQAASQAVAQARAAADALFGSGTTTFIVLPTVPQPAPPVRQSGPANDEWRSRCMAMLSIAGLAGLPQVHLPVGTTSGGLPIGVSLLGARGGDHALLALAQALAAPTAKAWAAAVAAAASGTHSAATVTAAAAAAAAAAGTAPSVANGADAAVESLKEKGNAAFKEGRYEDAIGQYTAALGRGASPQLRAVLLANRAMAHLKKGDFKACEEDCTTCLSADPRSVKALLRRGTARAFLGELTQAYDDFEAVLGIEPQNKDATAEIARLRRLAGREGV
jgi:Asp-tRNA(Asn)/Glu-tRNA(Gln) amidotransferase A subunit family amidase